VPQNDGLSRDEAKIRSEIAAIRSEQEVIQTVERAQQLLVAREAALDQQDRQLAAQLSFIDRFQLDSAFHDLPTKAAGKVKDTLSGGEQYADIWGLCTLALIAVLALKLILDHLGHKVQQKDMEKGREERVWLKKTMKASRLSPTLYEDPNVVPGQGNVTYKPACIWAITSVGATEGWDGTFKLDENQASKLLTLFESQNPDGNNGSLELNEILQFIAKPENKPLLEDLPSSARGILVEQLIKQAFPDFDKNKDGSLDKAEWHGFLMSLADCNLSYMHSMALLTWRCFYGLGQPWNCKDAVHPHNTKGHGFRDTLIKDLTAAAGSRIDKSGTIVPAPRQVQFGRDPDCLPGKWTPPGYWQDVYYCFANMHPFLGIFMCDTMHPLSSFERLMIELATLAGSFQSLHWKKQVAKGEPPLGITELNDPMVFSVLVVTLPGIVMWYILFLLFTTPYGGHKDLSRSTKEEIKRAYYLRTSCATLGYLAVAFVFSFYIYTVESDWTVSKGQTPMIIKARFNGYMINAIIPFLWYLNPFFAWGKTDPFKTAFDIGSIGDLIGMGQWRIEKQKFQATCVNAIELLKGEQLQSGRLTARVELEFQKSLEQDSKESPPLDATSIGVSPPATDLALAQVPAANLEFMQRRKFGCC